MPWRKCLVTLNLVTRLVFGLFLFFNLAFFKVFQNNFWNKRMVFRFENCSCGWKCWECSWEKFEEIQFFPLFSRYGEVVPLGSNYLPSYAEGVRTGIKELGPKLLGLDPRQTRVIYSVMDYELKGHPYVKSPIDMACWDILGKVTKIWKQCMLGILNIHEIVRIL